MYGCVLSNVLLSKKLILTGDVADKAGDAAGNALDASGMLTFNQNISTL